MSLEPSNDPIVQQLQLLLTGYGYNFYNQANQARADDLLVRERASYYLAQAVATLARLRGDYHTRFIPPLTRANPDPPQEAMAVPTQDRIWWRFRQEQPLLMQLLNFDLTLVRGSEQIYQYVSQLTPEQWNSQGSSSLRQMMQQLAHLAQERERLLLLPL
ncbi:MAG: hypothetical protein E6I93_12855 [Chloroflexi bacterium]|nr:MAG: hypothetical protein E6I93_12855 [Chloroflexota bacterium]